MTASHRVPFLPPRVDAGGTTQDVVVFPADRECGMEEVSWYLVLVER
jgi:hypothetical protein